MKLIVGLGNPGKEYDKTRHNVGFFMLDKYVENKFGSVTWSKKFNGLIYQAKLFGENVIFLKPQSFMNLSGGVVRAAVDYFKINLDDILIISDDLDLSIGNFKLKSSGSSGGHNGLKDIEKCLGSNKYKRLKIGISNNKNIDTKDYVLGNFNNSEIENLNNVGLIVIDIIDDFFSYSFDNLMNKYNRKNR